jgi:D-sedoheptulose 7-phosphate isomerase
MKPAGIRAGLEALARSVLDSAALSERVAAVAGRYAETLRVGGTIFFCGNGGSAANAQHIATEYLVRYSKSRRPLAAIALTTDSSLLTAAANDLGFEQVFARQVEALCRPQDLLVLHSTSGESPNLLAAARAARERSVRTVGFLGRGGGALAGQVDEAIVVPSDDTGRIQVIHLALEHLIVELVEEELARGA